MVENEEKLLCFYGLFDQIFDFISSLPQGVEPLDLFVKTTHINVIISRSLYISFTNCHFSDADERWNW